MRTDITKGRAHIHFKPQDFRPIHIYIYYYYLNLLYDPSIHVYTLKNQAQCTVQVFYQYSLPYRININVCKIKG